MAGNSIVSVLVPVAVAAPYTYRAPAGCQAGDIVSVPLGTRDVAGVVWDDPPDQSVGHNRLKAINGTFDVPPLNAEIRRFVDWVADYTLTSRGMVLRMVLRAPKALEPEAPVPGVRLAGAPPERMTPARQRVLAMLQETAQKENTNPAWTKSGLAAAAGVSPGVVQGLVDAGTLEIVMMPARPVALPPDPDYGAPELSAEQAAAADHLRQTVGGGYSVTLLDGVTGSGKTEVYFEAVAAAVTAGKQVLILLPEISLTADFLERFGLRFGTRPAEWHSQAAPRSRERVWRGVADGTLQVVVGARSALFLPFANLGLIVVDEEHDLAYKQEERAFYSARDMAVVRGHLAGFPVVLSSATPSIESRVNADAGRYTRIVLYRPLQGGGAARHRGDRPPPRPAGEGALPVAAAGQGGRRGDGAERTGAALPQPARLCAADALPHLRPPLPVPQLLHLAGRAPLSRRSALPPLRSFREAAGGLPRLRRYRELGAHRPRRRAAGRGSGFAVPRRTPDRSIERPCRRRRPSAAGACLDRQGRGRHRHRHPARRQGPQLPLPQAGRASSMPILAWRTAICAQPSAPSSF